MAIRLIRLAAYLAIFTWEPVAAIVGGEGVQDMSRFPYQASLQVNARHFCSGTIIDTNTILTAAHCVDTIRASEVRVVVGTTDAYTGGQRLAVVIIRTHPEYNRRTTTHDIAILKVAGKIIFNEYARAASFGRTGNPKSGDELLVSGWGAIKYDGPEVRYLRHLKTKSLAIPACREATGGGSSVGPGQICTKNSPGTGACQGDGGSALTTPTGELKGFLSWNTVCGSTSPDVYTNVAFHKKWIEQNRK